MMRFIETLYADPLLKFLVDTTMKSFVIFAVAGLFAFCLRRKSAAVRGFVWSMAIVGCLVVPMFSLILPKWELGILPVETPVSISQSRLSPKPVSSIPITPTSPQPNFVTGQSNPLTALHWTDWIAIGWTGAGLFLLIRLIVGIGAVWHISARSNNFSRDPELFPSNWNQQAHVRLSNKISVPMVWGFLRPVILLPTGAHQWQTDRLRAVLLHELAHIKRRDWVMQMIAQVVCTVYWFNPFVWFAARWMRIEAEQACDDQVLNAGYQPTDYAQHLLDIVRDVKVASFASCAAVAIAHSSKIEGRLRTVLAENLNRHPVTKGAIGIGLLVLTCCAVSMGAIHLAQAVDPKEVLSQPISSEEPPDRTTKAAQIDENVEICKGHLIEIGKAIQAYQKEHDDFPEWLSELYPKYLPDANILLCPADKVGGRALFPPNIDPKMPVSYGYGLRPGYRESTPKNRAMYGDVIPLVRCRHHTDQPFECLNLSFAFKVYPSSGVWEYTPEDMYGTPEKTIEALENGLQRQADNPPFFYVYRSLARLYIEVGREKDAEHLANHFKSTINPDDLQAHFALGAMLEIANQHQEMLKVFEKLEKRYPDDHEVLDELARIHEKLGNTELAEEYRQKADPMSELIRKVVPNFSATDLDGKPISLQQYRGKVVLLDFWAVWNSFCIGDILNVKRIYDTYKDQGFAVIGVSLDTDETKLRNYLKENNIPWRQIYSGEEKQCPLVKQYDVKSIPARWLIDRDGTLIAHEANHKLMSCKGREVDLERLVAAAVSDN